VFRDELDFSAASWHICCGSFGALQIHQDFGRNDTLIEPSLRIRISCILANVSGYYDDISRGGIDGRKAGVESDDNLWDLSRRLHLENNTSEYWLGFGAGYHQGQQEREILRRENAHLTFEKKVEYFVSILQRSVLCKQYNMGVDYLQNIQHWHLNQIPETICEKSLALLANGETQRAINEIRDYYRTSFALEAQIEIETLTSRLQNLRMKKRKSKDYGTTAERKAIEVDLQDWIIKHIL
jgi:hypothetical protein